MTGYTNISSTSEHDTLLKNNTYVLMDFTATWCPPCKMIAPIFEKLATQNAAAGDIAFAKVDVDEQQDLARKYGISAMPTFVLVKNGQVADSARGANPNAIQALVKQATDGVAAAKAAKPAAAKEEPKEEAKEETTVSGSYGMSSSKHWKESLR